MFSYFKKIEPISLRSLLVLVMLLLMATVLASILLITQWVVGYALEQSAVQSLTTRTTAARNRIDQEMHERLRDVTLAASSLQGEFGLDAERARALIHGMAERYPDYSWVAVVDRNGIVKVGTKGMLEGQSVATRTWFPEGLKGPFVGDVHEATLLGKLMGEKADKQPWRFVDFSLPLTDPDGEVVGVFAAHLNWEWAHSVLSSFEGHPKSERGCEILILDKNGIVLYGPESLRGKFFEVPSGTNKEQPAWKMDAQWLVAAAPSLGHLDYKGLGWTVAMREPMDEVLAPAHDVRHAIMVWSLLMVAVFLLVALWVGRWIARPLETLSQAAREDRFLPDPNSRYCEVVQLNEALGGMLQRLSDRKEEIRREVQARTAEVKHLTDALDAHAIVSISDARGTITYVNEKFCAISGYSAEELIGQNHSLVKSDVHSSEFYKELWKTIRSGNSWQGKVCNRRKDGSLYWVQSTITPTKDNKSAKHFYISIRTDITDLINEQEARRAAEIAADKANRAKSAFLSSMSHELRTPLNSILGFAQILESSKKNPLNEKQHNHIKQIIRGGEHLLSLINEVLDLALIEAGKLSLSIEPVALGDLIAYCLAMIHGQAERQNISLVGPRWMDKNIFVQADHMRLKQVFINLLSNAIKYNRPHGSVTVLVNYDGHDRVRISVQDTGFGIPLEKQPEIFRPFNRLGAETSEIEGTGIGLTITRSLTRSMGGSIGFVSTPGEGSVFWVEFPPALVATQQRQPPEDPVSEEGQAPSQNMQAHQLLYIEDNPSNVRLLEGIFEELPNFQVKTLPNAELGLVSAQNSPPDLILLDINLPGMSGIEALGHLKKNQKTSHIPVLVLSADATQVTIKQALEAGCLDYLTKPINIDRLMAAINLALKD